MQKQKTLASVLIAGCLPRVFPAASQDFRFDSSMSRPVLENYRSRSISFTELLHDDLTKPRNSRGVDPRDNLRLIRDTKTKFVLVTSYIDVGIEAIHFGQVGLMDKNDPGHAGWLDMLGRVRAYARQNARRHFLVCDAHTPTGGYVEDGKLLFDFHSFPLRISEVADHPYQGVLKVGYADSIFTKSKGGRRLLGTAANDAA